MESDRVIEFSYRKTCEKEGTIDCIYLNSVVGDNALLIAVIYWLLKKSLSTD